MEDKKIIKRWFCGEHGLEGEVGKSWCFGCYKINDDTDSPVPYRGYKTKKEIEAEAETVDEPAQVEQAMGG